MACWCSPLLFGVLEMGRLYFTVNALDEAARRGARLAAVCNISDPVVLRRAIFNAATDAGTSQLISSLATTNLALTYLDVDGAVVANPGDTSSATGFRAIRYVRLSVQNFVFQPVRSRLRRAHHLAHVPGNLATRKPWASFRFRGDHTMLNTRETPLSTATGRAGLRILISSRDATSLRDLQCVCQRMPGLEVSTRLVSNGHVDPLYGLDRMPDLLLLRVSHLWREELSALLQRPAHERPPMLVCGPLGEQEGMRLAMQAGARDVLPEPIADTELVAALNRLVADVRLGSGNEGKLVAVISAKGGSGGTLVACNLAQQLSARAGNTLLLDMDLQFGSVTHYLDVAQSHSHLEVLQQIDDMDSVALRGFFAATSARPCTYWVAGLANCACPRTPNRNSSTPCCNWPAPVMTGWWWTCRGRSITSPVRCWNRWTGCTWWCNRVSATCATPVPWCASFAKTWACAGISCRS
nr:hypothetical protein GCM10020185_57740 [Pseudomonas brassicacearum subsp. brassicacearum]